MLRARVFLGGRLQVIRFVFAYGFRTRVRSFLGEFLRAFKSQREATTVRRRFRLFCLFTITVVYTAVFSMALFNAIIFKVALVYNFDAPVNTLFFNMAFFATNCLTIAV